MNWNNLKSYKCPKCGALMTNPNKTQHICTECDFRIGNEKFERIVTSKYQRQRCVTFEENLSALNNLGRRKVTKDFSDSPHLNY